MFLRRPFPAWFWSRAGYKGNLHTIWKVEVKPWPYFWLVKITEELPAHLVAVGQQLAWSCFSSYQVSFFRFSRSWAKSVGSSLEGEMQQLFCRYVWMLGAWGQWDPPAGTSSPLGVPVCTCSSPLHIHPCLLCAGPAGLRSSTRCKHNTLK